MKKRSDEKKSHGNLSDKVGTVAYAIVANKDEINEICFSGISLNEAKEKIIKIIEDNSRNCKSRDKIFYNIRVQKKMLSLHTYLYDLVLAGDNMEVIKINQRKVG